MRGRIIIEVELRGVEPVAPPHAVSQNLERGEEELAAGIDEPVDVPQIYDLPYCERDHAPNGKLSVLHLDQQPLQNQMAEQSTHLCPEDHPKQHLPVRRRELELWKHGEQKEGAQRRSFGFEQY